MDIDKGYRDRLKQGMSEATASELTLAEVVQQGLVWITNLLGRIEEKTEHRCSMPTDSEAEQDMKMNEGTCGTMNPNAKKCCSCCLGCCLLNKHVNACLNNIHHPCACAIDPITKRPFRNQNSGRIEPEQKQVKPCGYFNCSYCCISNIHRCGIADRKGPPACPCFPVSSTLTGQLAEALRALAAAHAKL